MQRYILSTWQCIKFWAVGFFLSSLGEWYPDATKAALTINIVVCINILAGMFITSRSRK